MIATHSPEQLGVLLKQWRGSRHMSQLDLSLAANVSARHISFIETGRSRPSREMVMQLANVMEVPLREQNDLLSAAGYAPMFRETGLDDPAMVDVRRALEFILKAQEPYAAIVVDRHWNLIQSNAAAARLIGLFVPADSSLLATPPLNALRLTCHPDGLRPAIANWHEVGRQLIDRTRHETIGGLVDPETQDLIDEVLAYPDVPQDWHETLLIARAPPVLTLDLRKDDVAVRLFSTITTFGTPQDITVQELRIESFFPADPESEAVLQRLAKGD